MDLPRHWRLRDTRYRLEGNRCNDCGTLFFPPRPLCPKCRSTELVAQAFSGRGQVYSYTTVYKGPAGFSDFLPYTVALVQLDEGPLITAQLTDVDPEEVTIGMPVEMVTRTLREYGKDGFIVYGYKFRPVLR